MNATAKWILSAVVVPVLIGLGASQAALARLDERLAAVKAIAEEAKLIAQDAHKRINFFHGGG